MTSEQGLPVAGLMQMISPGQSHRHTTDVTSMPLAGPLLSAFDNEGLAGGWKVRLYNRTADQILPEGVKLRLVRKS
ncbi:MAG: hypothetical protein BGP24_00380 [Lysobacterales bacterium 69-70]|nr:hypothetical protein [Xanthomonadaceae bacterium]ODU36230.1 MAG: hypothetical protein ABS97_02590 [Xanthomonadaceae bacterium SCN 69-320]ODV17932.1 MAG: hypothetical protein ABT27_15875 [Xanthomonadaceae bacterium SCN 69-25]OJY99312.1 MAG: hypothetical protein BGP24_00380 [Xanthomonadales bacterium 69-70]